jgi:hypothetical protein
MTNNPSYYWKRDIKQGFDLMSLANTYAEDGAYLTASERLQKASEAFKRGFDKRQKFMEKNVK